MTTRPSPLLRNGAKDAKTEPTIRSIFRRAVIPAAALVVFAVFANLWHSGSHDTYRHILRFVGVEPFIFPFVDIHAVLTAGECYQEGINVYAQNPCDVLGRVHVYSPLWLSVMPPSLASAAFTAWAGVILDLIFIVDAVYL